MVHTFCLVDSKYLLERSPFVLRVLWLFVSELAFLSNELFLLFHLLQVCQVLEYPASQTVVVFESGGSVIDGLRRVVLNIHVVHFVLFVVECILEFALF